MKRAAVILHVAHEDLDAFEPVLRERGYEIETVCAPFGAVAALDPLEADLLVVMGGPIGVYQDDAFPFLRDEVALLEQRLAADRPTLGICLGCQLMARALGARVYAGGGPEIGYGPIELTVAGTHGALRHLGRGPVLHWHGDTFDLPDGAVRLAKSPRYANQAFRYGSNALALQFHPEVSARGLERWLVAAVGEIGATEGLSVTGLRADAARICPDLERQGAAFLDEWLAGLPQ